MKNQQNELFRVNYLFLETDYLNADYILATKHELYLILDDGIKIIKEIKQIEYDCIPGTKSCAYTAYIELDKKEAQTLSDKHIKRIRLRISIFPFGKSSHGFFIGKIKRKKCKRYTHCLLRM